MNDSKKRHGKIVYTLLPGEKWKIYNGVIVICHPEKPPKIIDKEGNVTELKPL